MSVHRTEARLRVSMVLLGASVYHRNASVSFWATPRPIVYIHPTLNCVHAVPWAADNIQHRRAPVESCGTPQPNSYIEPRLNCAPVWFCSAANLYQRTAAANPSGTPCPVLYIMPSVNSAYRSPSTARGRNTVKAENLPPPPPRGV